MFENIKWLFFDVGSTLVDESRAYEHRLREMADLAGRDYEDVFETAMEFYRQNKRGDLETAKLLGVALTKWHTEDECLYSDAAPCLERLSREYKIGIIANQSPGTSDRLAQHGLLQYIDLVVASAEEGVAKPDRRIFEIALERSGCAPENALMVGDRIDNDIVPARLLGMGTVWLRQGFGKYWKITRPMEQPDLTVDTLTELCGNLLRRTSL